MATTIHPPHPLKTLVLTLFALIAFAGNSVLCRLALGEDTIDPASFTIIRLLSGAIMLSILGRLPGRQSQPRKQAWRPALILCAYAITFSLAYTTLPTGVGALVLFGTVQLTMLAAALLAGERIGYTEWLGVVAALVGFIYLMLPGVSAPPLMGTALMTVAGIGWGLYTLLGRGSTDALGDNARNFVYTLPILAVLAVINLGGQHLSLSGTCYAAISGAITSGLGYTIWYMALGGLTTSTAAVVQLSVPIIAAAGGVLFMDELISARLSISAALILGGIGLVVLGASRRRR